MYRCYPSSTSAAVDQETKKLILKSTTNVLLSGRAVLRNKENDIREV